jgi:hypothetical protein
VLDDNDRQEHTLICLHGQGGTGKSIIMKKASAYARSLNKIVCTCAATNIAAIQHENCMTAHSLFGYPVIDDYEVNDATIKTACTVSEERLALLDEAEVVLWDEVFMSHMDHMDAVLELLKKNRKLIFVLIGDGRQTPVVVPNGNTAQTILASIISSTHWTKFQVITVFFHHRLYYCNLIS